MDKGKIVQTGTPTELLFKPANDFVQKFFDEQRLQLEYKTVTLKMLWKFFIDVSDNSSAKEISADKNIWQALEFFSLSENETLIIKNDTQTKKINYASLMNAFNQYKKSN